MAKLLSNAGLTVIISMEELKQDLLRSRPTENLTERPIFNGPLNLQSDRYLKLSLLFKAHFLFFKH